VQAIDNLEQESHTPMTKIGNALPPHHRDASFEEIQGPWLGMAQE
jgi:hypothetical protein